MPQPKRTRRSAAQWKALLDEQQRSGQSQAAFCAARGLTLSNFGYWRRKLRTSVPSDPVSNTPEWIELPGLVAQMHSPTTDTGRGWDLELDLGHGLQLRLRHVVS